MTGLALNSANRLNVAADCSSGDSVDWAVAGDAGAFFPAQPEEHAADKAYGSGAKWSRKQLGVLKFCYFEARKF